MSLKDTMFQAAIRLVIAGAAVAVLAACGGGGGGGSSGSAPSTTTTISGKVTVPASVASSKPGYAAKLMANQPHGKPGSKAYMASRKAAVPSSVQVPMGSYAKAFDLGAVWLYDANHPEWLYPVATADVVAGAYTLSKTKFSALNGNAYQDDQPIPAGKYTLYAYDAADSGLIALKVIVNEYTGDVVGVDLVAEPSDVAPVVQTILGAKKNTNGTYTWGSATNDSTAANYISIKKNGAVQISFSTAMNRISIKDNIAIATAAGAAVSGDWQVSPDWKTAIFKPTNGSLAAGNYVITVKGKDSYPSAYVKNVYGNALAYTSTGYFTVVDITDTAAPNGALQLYINGSYSINKDSVDVSAAVRLKSDELLDVSTIMLSGTPSLGAKPTASYVGKDSLDPTYPFVYEFTLGEPLKVGTSYTLTVSGGKDLAGNTMNSPNYSFTTATASELSGISDTADAATQEVQAQVKDVFGKWVRAMSDRNLAQVQGLMTGGFVYEYDAGLTGISEDDVNMDSRFSLNEFSAMLQKAFNGWEMCGTTLTGDVTADITVSGSLAGMEFMLTAASTNTSQMCAEMAPKQKMYAVLEQVNGAWYVSRAAEGIDIRNKDLVLREVITLTSPAEGAVLTSNPATFEWKALPGVTSYLLLIGDDKGQGGLAVVVPYTTTKVVFSDSTLNGTGLLNGIADVTFLFDGPNMAMSTLCVPTSTMTCNINTLDIMRDGATYKWEVMGLGTNTFDSFKNGTYKDVFRDITAISRLATYKNAGTYLELSWSLLNATGGEVPYNDWYWAYDAGSEGTVTLQVTAPKTGTLNIGVNGSSYSYQSVSVTAGVASNITLDLYKGMNWVWMDFSDGAGTYLYDGFAVTTTGGIPPAVAITSVVDNGGLTYTACGTGTAPCIDQWSYLGGTSASSVTINGTVDLTQIPGASSVGISIWNPSGAYEYKEVAVSVSGTFTVATDLYNGDNWFSFSAHDAEWMVSGYSSLGINTTSIANVWVPPIAVNLPGTPDVVALMGDYGGNQDWDASNDPDNQITLTGTLKAPNQSYAAQYYVSSDGNWQSGNLAVSGNSFTLPVTLYHGWNWISIDDGSGNWYGVNVYTSAGVIPTRPVITAVAGQPFDSTITNSVTLDASGTNCAVTLSGTLGDTAGNALTANWYGYDGNTSYYEQSITTSGSGGAFSVTLPVVGTAVGAASSYNYLDLYDEQWNWAGAVVYETSSCGYTPPVNTVTGVSAIGDTASLNDYGYGSYGVTLTTGQATAITVSGNNTKTNRTITGTLYSCGSHQQVQVTSAGDGSWSLGTFNLYDGYNSIGISDGYNWSTVEVTTTNGLVAPMAITLLSSLPMPTAQTYADCYGAGYDIDMTGAADITMLTVNGVLNMTPGQSGSFNIGSTSGTFTTDLAGNFTVDVPVVNGYNYLYLYDADWNSYSVNLNITNGYTPPPALTIDTPAHNDALPVGSTTVSGHIDSTQWSGVPTLYYAWVYNGAVGTYVDYSSDSVDQSYGYSPITVDAAGNFTFSANIPETTNYTQIYVYAYDSNAGYSHGHSIYVNNLYSYVESSWKPGSRPTASSVVKNAIATERKLKHMALMQAKSRDSKRLLRR